MTFIVNLGLNYSVLHSCVIQNFANEDQLQTMTVANPILVEVTRGDMVESYHRGAAVVVAEDGNVIASYGNIDQKIYPRSAIKPLQALCLIESGAADRFQLNSQHIALACASHSGEAYHVSKIESWLNKIGLSGDALECGAQPPSHRDSREFLIRERTPFTAVYNNCSGKHAGFLTTAVYYGEPVAGYIKASHPAQQRVLATLEELTGESLTGFHPGVDGCGIPTPLLSLRGIALANIRLVTGKFNSDIRKRAATNIVEAMAKHPELVGGTGRFCTLVSQLTGGSVLVKVGAEGVYAGMSSRNPRVGFALKIDDGATRAAEVAMGGLIERFCKLKLEEVYSLRPRLQPIVHNVAKRGVGEIRAVFA